VADQTCGDCHCAPGTCVRRASDVGIVSALFSEPKPERCPAYGKDCACPPESAVRRICERTAANIHR
jgi:hypothetical protein